MFCLQKTRRLLEYFLICIITLSLECFAATETENERIGVETEDPLNTWHTVPSGPIDAIQIQYPYLYVTTVIFASIVLGMTLLILLRSCIRTCKVTTSMPFQSAPIVPVITRFRRSLVPTDTILINGSFVTGDKPPDYVTIMQTSTEVRSVPSKETSSMMSTESPPPSYETIV